MFSWGRYLEDTCSGVLCQMLTKSCLLVPHQWTRLCLSPGSCSREVSSFSSSCLQPLDGRWLMDGWRGKRVVLFALSDAYRRWGVSLCAPHSLPSCAYKSLVVLSYFLSHVSSCCCLFMGLQSISENPWSHSINPQGPMTTKKIHKPL